MSLNPPTVLLDRTFIDALVSPDHPRHEHAVAAYRDLIDEFEANHRLLAATSPHLAEVPPDVRSALLAPVTSLRVAHQHRSAAERVRPPAGTDPDFAGVLVVLHRHRIRTVATFDPRFGDFDLDLLPAPPETTDGTDPEAQLSN